MKTIMKYQPMLAQPLAKGDIREWNDWAIEEKFDGHRLLVHVANDVRAYTRPRKHAGATSKTMAERELSIDLVHALAALPKGVYDGELVANVDGGTATDVKRLDLAGQLTFVVFDILEVGGRDVTRLSYDDRRALLKGLSYRWGGRVVLTPSKSLTCQEDVTSFVEGVWKRDGEGAILKRRSAPYQSGKRSTDFLKVKRIEHAVLTVIGFEASRGDVMNRGPFAIVLLEDADGNRTTCKTLNDEELAAFNAQAAHPGMHPAIGRRLMIEYLGRTRDGGYRGPVTWDRWDNE